GPAKVDTDSPVIGYDEARYQLVFSDPVVIAARAAPPAKPDIGQNVDGCSTAFGNTNTTIVERERSVTFKAGVSVGVQVDGGVLTQSARELRATITVEATRTGGTGDELSKTIAFTTAPTEDTAVLTCAPGAQYR